MALLTIAIPTYNRASYLKRCLDSINRQLEEVSSDVELIVSNNCSTDSTEVVVNEFVNGGMPIKYILNEVNRGPDFNISQCYRSATSKYIVVFGDDDVWLPGSISSLLTILRKDEEWGLVHLKALPLRTNYNPDIAPIKSLPCSIFSDTKGLLKRVNFFVTFISGNVVNRKFVQDFPFEQYFSTSLVQVPLILKAIYGGLRNIYIDKFVIGGQVDNSGGYNFFKVFGTNFYKILADFKPQHPDFPLKSLTNEVLVSFFPHWIVKYRKNDLGRFEHENPYNLLRSIYEDKLLLWVVIYPLFFLPLSIIGPYLFGVKVFGKFRRFCVYYVIP
jgi:abequosyltransferase